MVGRDGWQGFLPILQYCFQRIPLFLYGLTGTSLAQKRTKTFSCPGLAPPITLLHLQVPWNLHVKLDSHFIEGGVCSPVLGSYRVKIQLHVRIGYFYDTRSRLGYIWMQNTFDYLTSQGDSRPYSGLAFKAHSYSYTISPVRPARKNIPKLLFVCSVSCTGLQLFTVGVG